MVRLDLILDDVGICDETIAFVRKGFLNFYLKNPNSPTNLQEVKPVKALKNHQNWKW